MTKTSQCRGRNFHLKMINTFNGQSLMCGAWGARRPELGPQLPPRSNNKHQKAKIDERTQETWNLEMVSEDKSILKLICKYWPHAAGHHPPREHLPIPRRRLNIRKDQLALESFGQQPARKIEAQTKVGDLTNYGYWKHTRFVVTKRWMLRWEHRSDCFFVAQCNSLHVLKLSRQAMWFVDSSCMCCKVTGVSIQK